jgi:two-component system, OmpR family, sensor histidine kinase VicK
MTTTSFLPEPHTMKVIHGTENIREAALRALRDIKEQMDGCSDPTAPYVLFATKEAHEGILELIRRGIKLRYLTQVLKSNIQYCKNMLDDGIEVRHLDGVKGNFTIVDKTDCILYSVQSEGQEPMQIIITNTKSFVEQQQLFFDNLWSKAISAQKRIKELEREHGATDEFVETISDPLKIKTFAKI